jgi:hypothetical protein
MESEYLLDFNSIRTNKRAGRREPIKKKKQIYNIVLTSGSMVKARY